MEYVQALFDAIACSEGCQHDDQDPKSLLARATGRFYTPVGIGRRLATLTANCILKQIFSYPRSLRLVDPFGGDGRLIQWMLDAVADLGFNESPFREIHIWDCDETALEKAATQIASCLEKYNWSVDIQTSCVDTFAINYANFGTFDCIITNPPWKNLKPDRRELSGLSQLARDNYIDLLRRRDHYLGSRYPLSQPRRKFSGWGTNLARVGTELSLELSVPGGTVAVVTPASFFGDQNSEQLRYQLISHYRLHYIDFFPAEARLFQNVDSATTTFVATRHPPSGGFRPRLRTFDQQLNLDSQGEIRAPKQYLHNHAFCLPIRSGPYGFRVLTSLSSLPQVTDLESHDCYALWTGRELDETAHYRFTSPDGDRSFIKGRMVKRYSVQPDERLAISSANHKLPPSVDFYRVVWRDVSRPTQKRRMQAAVLPPGFVAGNSLHVAHFYDRSVELTFALAAIFNSIVFEFQVRAFLMTGHLSLGVVRRCHIPAPNSLLGSNIGSLARALQENDESQYGHDRIEVAVARLYGIDRDTFKEILEAFPKISDSERQQLLTDELWEIT